MLAALSLVAGAGAAVPGTGAVVDAVSDEFEAPWSFDYQTNRSANGLWYGSFRGAPETLQIVPPPGGSFGGSEGALVLRSIDDNDDPWPTQEDLVSVFHSSTALGRALTAAEQPAVMAWVWFPPVAVWPWKPDGQNCFGLRTAARDGGLEYYPSLIAWHEPDGSGTLRVRIGDGVIADFGILPLPSQGGWYTLGISWNEAGRTEYYAAPGRVSLTAEDLVCLDNWSDREMETLEYHFFSIGYPESPDSSPDFLADRCLVFTQAIPLLPTLRVEKEGEDSVRVRVEGCAAGFGYDLERNAALQPASWDPVERWVSDGTDRTITLPAGGPAAFFRVGR